MSACLSIPASKNPSRWDVSKILVISIYSELTATQIIITGTVTLHVRRRLASRHIAANNAASALKPLALRPMLLRLSCSAGLLIGTHTSAMCLAEQLPDLDKVGFECVDVPFRLSMLAARADGDRAIFDDVPDSESIAGCRAEAEVAEGWIAAVGGGEDGVVQHFPA